LKRSAPEAAEVGIRVTLVFSAGEQADFGRDVLVRELGDIAFNAADVLRRFDYRVGSPKPATTPTTVSTIIVMPYNDALQHRRRRLRDADMAESDGAVVAP
jgi:hypothetical protein